MERQQGGSGGVRRERVQQRLSTKKMSNSQAMLLLYRLP